MIICHRPHGAALLCILREGHQQDHQNNRHNRRNNIQLIYEKPIEVRATQKGRGLFNPKAATLWNTNIKFLNVRAPHHVAKAFHEIGQTDGGHEQDNRLLPNQMAENEMLHHPGQSDHHCHGQKNGRKGRNVPAEMMHIRAKNRVD